eukprot:5763-Heterococcus_DN1.PRE.2
MVLCTATWRTSLSSSCELQHHCCEIPAVSGVYNSLIYAVTACMTQVTPNPAVKLHVQADASQCAACAAKEELSQWAMAFHCMLIECTTYHNQLLAVKKLSACANVTSWSLMTLCTAALQHLNVLAGDFYGAYTEIAFTNCSCAQQLNDHCTRKQQSAAVAILTH